MWLGSRNQSIVAWPLASEKSEQAKTREFNHHHQKSSFLWSLAEMESVNVLAGLSSGEREEFCLSVHHIETQR